MSVQSKKEMERDLAFFKQMFQQCKDSVHIINDKLTAIQVATENIWGEIDKKDFYTTQQIETIIRSVGTISSKIEIIENSLAVKEKYKVHEIPEKSDGKKKILLAEDDYDTSNMIKVLLEKANIEVKTAVDGKEAFKIFEKHNFDMIITDVNMPEYSGPQLKNKIREIDTEIPVLFISGYDKSVTRKIAKNDDKAFFLSKPFNHKDIISMIEENIR